MEKVELSFKSLFFEEAGLILTVQVERIDDNGFVTFNVSPPP